MSTSTGEIAHEEAIISGKNVIAGKGMVELTKTCKNKGITLWFWVVLHTLMRFETPKRRRFCSVLPRRFQNEQK